MRLDQVSAWRSVGIAFAIDVIAPCHVELSDGSVVDATALVMVGPPKGMVVDPRWEKLAAHAKQLVADGFGYSAVEIKGEPTGLSDLLRDWGWRP